MNDPTELVLSAILAELQQHHAYVRERDARLDSEHAQQKADLVERNARNDALMEEQSRLARSAFSNMQPSSPAPVDVQLLSAVNAPYFSIANVDLANRLIRELGSDVQNCGRASIVLALQEAHPKSFAYGLADAIEFESIFHAAEDYISAYPPEAVGWNDFWMARWLILHDPKAVPEITRRTALSGPVGDTARWMVNSMASVIPQFAEDLQQERLMTTPHAGGNA